MTQTERKLYNKRIDDEIELQRAIIAEIYSAFKKLAALGYEGVYRNDFQFSQLDSDRLDKILTDLRLIIYVWIVTYCKNIAQETHDSYDYAAAPLSVAPISYLTLPRTAEDDTRTVKELIYTYTNRFKYEAEAWIAAGLAGKIPLAKLITEFATQSNKPYNNNIFRNAVKLGDVAASRIRTGGISYGRGQYTSAENSLVRLGRYAVADTMRQAQWHEWNGENAPTLLGFNVSRGSNYPCSLCDSFCGFHPADRAWLPPYHSRCCCVATPVFSIDNVSSTLALL